MFTKWISGIPRKSEFFRNRFFLPRNPLEFHGIQGTKFHGIPKTKFQGSLGEKATRNSGRNADTAYKLIRKSYSTSFVVVGMTLLVTCPVPVCGYHQGVSLSMSIFMSMSISILHVRVCTLFVSVSVVRVRVRVRVRIHVHVHVHAYVHLHFHLTEKEHEKT